MSYSGQTTIADISNQLNDDIMSRGSLFLISSSSCHLPLVRDIDLWSGLELSIIIKRFIAPETTSIENKVVTLGTRDADIWHFSIRPKTMLNWVAKCEPYSPVTQFWQTKNLPNDTCNRLESSPNGTNCNGSTLRPQSKLLRVPIGKLITEYGRMGSKQLFLVEQPWYYRSRNNDSAAATSW